MISSLAPATITAGSADFKLTVTGQNFLPSSAVQWNGVALLSNTISPTQIQATVPAADAATVGSATITVVDPSPVSLTSNSAPFSITAVQPVIAAVSVASVVAGAGPLTVTLTGQNFASGAVVSFGPTALATTYVGTTQLRALIPASLLTTIGTYNITVANPAPNAATSNPFMFSVTAAPPPSITNLSPSSVTAGASAFTLTVSGQSFPAGSTVQWNGQTLTSLGSSSSISATVPDAYVSAAGTYPVTVAYPSNGSGTKTTAPVNFTVNPLPAGMAIMNQTANDVAADPIRNVIYASVPSTAVQNGNCIIAIDASTGSVTKSVNAGSEPNRIAVSSDGQFLYVALDGASSVKRFVLPNLTEDFTVSLGADSFFGANTALDLAVSSSPHVWAVTSGNLGVSPAAQKGVSVYDDAVQRGASVGRNSPHGGFDFLAGTIIWGADTSVLYAANNESTGFDLFSLPISQTGIGTIKDFGSAMPGFNNLHIHYDATTGDVYGDSGYVVNPATGAAVGQFAYNGPMTTDGGLKTAFFITSSTGSSASGILASFDLTKFTPVNTLSFPNVSGVPVRLVRWGAAGVAFNTLTYNYSRSTTTKTGKIYLYSGAFVKPNWSLGRILLLPCNTFPLPFQRSQVGPVL